MRQAHVVPTSGSEKAVLSPPSSDASALTVLKLHAIKDVLVLEGVDEVPERFWAEKYFKMQLHSGQVCGTFRMGASPDAHRDHLVRARSTVRQRSATGAVVYEAASVYGAVHHFVVVFVNGRPRVYALISCVKSSADRRGIYRLAEKRRETECFLSLGGVKRYVCASAIDAVVGTLYMRSEHVVLNCREARERRRAATDRGAERRGGFAAAAAAAAATAFPPRSRHRSRCRQQHVRRTFRERTEYSGKILYQ